MDETAKQIAEAALRIGAIKLQPSDPFTWASGFRMPIYNDNRLLLSEAACRKVVVEGLRKRLHKKLPEGCDVIAGTATAGIPWGTSLADALELPLVYVREKPKDHGKKKRVEGILPQNARVVVIEDLVSTGRSSLSAVEGIRAEGGKCNLCLAIFSYGFPEAERAFSDADASFDSLLKFPELLEVARELGKISSTEFELLQSWSSEPFEWGERNGFSKVERS